MKRTPSRRSAQKSDEFQSLFKFMLYFHEHTNEFQRKAGKPWVWYSFDMPDEREMFAPGLNSGLRHTFGELLKAAYRWPDLYDFLRECYPIMQPREEVETLTLYPARKAWEGAQEIGVRYGETLSGLMKTLEVSDWQVSFAERSRTTPGLSPIRVPSHEFYGIRAFEQNPQVSYWFSTRMLKLVKVYDHRCYHVENLYGTISQEEYPMPTGVLMPPPRTQAPGNPKPANGRINATTRLGDMLQLHTNPTPA